jgi:ABC-type multidrug transport system ATPase subunit/ABC-type multidrug transport system permease subunit
MLIGRDPSCEFVIDSPLVSGRHARLEQLDGCFYLIDLDSANGTFVDGARIQRQALAAGNTVLVGNVSLRFDGRRLIEQGSRAQLKIEVRSMFYRPAGLNHDLLQNINFTIEPGQFVAIVGTSGAGKSTMMGVLSAQVEPTQGSVLYNGVPASSRIELYRNLMGFVPQDDIVHKDLEVEAALRYAAQLRLPLDTKPAEIQRRLDTVIATVELSHRRNNRISTLSGGERKRVSIGVELLTEPSLFFLDEPTSGLDPGMEKKAMLLLSRLSRQGRTVALITHATQNIVLCDRVLLLSPGGRMTYYGPPRQALNFFEVEDFADIYLKIDTPEKGAEWQQRFLKSAFYSENTQGSLAVSDGAFHHPGHSAHGVGETIHRFFQQLWVLAKRYLHLIRNDRGNLILLCAQAPAIGVILSLLFTPNLYSLRQEWSNNKLPIKEGPTLLFLLMVSCLFFGSINSCREVVKELNVVRRERLVNLNLLSYFASKILILSIIGMVQSLILLVVVTSRIPLQVETSVWWLVAFFLALASIGGTLIGLLLSCICVSAEQASTMVSVILIVQLALSGAFIKPEEMLGPVSFASIFCLSRWVFAAIGSVTNMNQRFIALQLGSIGVDFNIPWTDSMSVLFPLLGLHALLALAALRLSEQRKERS